MRSKAAGSSHHGFWHFIPSRSFKAFRKKSHTHNERCKSESNKRKHYLSATFTCE